MVSWLRDAIWHWQPHPPAADGDAAEHAALKYPGRGPGVGQAALASISPSVVCIKPGQRCSLALGKDKGLPGGGGGLISGLCPSRSPPKESGWKEARELTPICLWGPQPAGTGLVTGQGAWGVGWGGHAVPAAACGLSLRARLPQRCRQSWAGRWGMFMGLGIPGLCAHCAANTSSRLGL